MRTVRSVVEFVDARTRGRRTPGSEWETDDERAEGLRQGGLVVFVGEDGRELRTTAPWRAQEGRHLETAPVEAGGYRVVACLNVWQDARALRTTLETWLPHVDRVIAVDGAYEGSLADRPASTDGTLELLRTLPRTEVVEAPTDRFWRDQVEKRNAYCDRLEPGDLAFVVDADEFVSGAEILRDLPRLDVGWVPYRKGIYEKAQDFPRLFDARIRPRYDGRHYWVTGARGFVTDCQTGGPGYDHRAVPVEVDNTRGSELRDDWRRSAKKVAATSQVRRERAVGEGAPTTGRESLRVAQVTSIDPGMVAFRLHSAINGASPHASVLGTRDLGRVYEEPTQYDLKRDRDSLRDALATCDLAHCHLHYQPLDQLGVQLDPGTPTVIHHHGTMYRDSADLRNRQDARRADVRFVSNPELLRYGEDLHFLPNPVPVARYARAREALWRPDSDGLVRIGHSPSKRENKGTEAFLRAVESLRSAGLPVRPVLIENVTHAEAVAVKASECDLFFDSFWLGLQCSGLEAAAMGVPVVAGDEHVRSHYEREYGSTPHEHADDESSLREVLAALVTDEGMRRESSARVSEYATAVHDYAAVVRRYLDVLDDELEWRSRLSLSGSGGRFLRV